MEDVARSAGVNKATVSRALRGDPRISAATREKVWKTAKELGYRLDLAASGLSRGKTGIAAIVIGELNPWFSKLFFSGLNRVLIRSGLDILLKLPGIPFGEIFAGLEARRVDCILCAGGTKEKFLPVLEKITSPVVTAGFSISGIPAVFVSPEKTVERLEEISGGRPLRYYSGNSPCFPFLSDLIPGGEVPEGNEFPVLDGILWNGLPPERGCVCTLPDGRVPETLYSMEWPAFELGIAAGRVLIRTLHGNDAGPETTWLVPGMRRPGGEREPYVKNL